MLFFKKKSLHPLEQALHLTGAATEIVARHKRNAAFIPTEEDLETLGQIGEMFHHGYVVTSYVERCLRQRLRGDPEGSRKWHDKAVFDYHYPP